MKWFLFAASIDFASTILVYRAGGTEANPLFGGRTAGAFAGRFFAMNGALFALALAAGAPTWVWAAWAGAHSLAAAWNLSQLRD